MKKRTRRLLFWVAVILFGFFSWIAIRYAQGYVFDFKTNSFVRTGAIVITANTSATLIIDDREVGSTSFLSNRAGKDGLVPGTYAVRVERENYSLWRKTATVQVGALTDFPKVLLLPTDDAAQAELKREASQSLAESRTLRNALKPVKRTALPEVRVGDIVLRGSQLLDMRTASASVIADQVLGFTPTDNGSRVLWWTRNELWVLWLRNTDYQPYRTENERAAITRFSVPIVRAAWFRDDDHIVVDLGNQTYRILETDTRGGTNIIKL